MLLFVPLQGFPAPMRKAGSCRALYSAVTEIFLIPVALTCGVRVMMFHAKCLRNFSLSICSQSFTNGFLLDLSYCCSYLCSDLSDNKATLWQWMSLLSWLLNCPTCPHRFPCQGFRSPTVQHFPSWIWHILTPFSTLPNKFCLAWSAVKFLILLGLWHFWEIFLPPSVVTCLRPVESWNE